MDEKVEFVNKIDPDVIEDEDEKDDQIVLRHRNVRVVLKKDDAAFEDVRCSECNTLLFKTKRKEDDEIGIQIKCRKCGHLLSV